MTSQMVRKQIYISRRQQALLKRLSEQRGLSEAEIIRQAIDREAANAVPRNDLTSQEAWEKAYQFMVSLRERAGQFSEPLRWNREELYEERLRRYDSKSQSPSEGKGGL
jgi:hypothetical protein